MAVWSCKRKLGPWESNGKTSQINGTRVSTCMKPETSAGLEAQIRVWVNPILNLTNRKTKTKRLHKCLKFRFKDHAWKICPQNKKNKALTQILNLDINNNISNYIFDVKCYIIYKLFNVPESFKWRFQTLQYPMHNGHIKNFQSQTEMFRN